MPNHDLKQGQTRRGTAIQTDVDRESLSLAERLASDEELTAPEAFDAVNFISQEYNPINKDNISAKQPQVGTTFFDLAGANQVARYFGAINPRIDNSFLGNLEANKPDQFYGEQQYDLNTFKGLVNRGFITTKDGTPINIQSGPLATRTVEGDPYYATYQEYLNNPQNFKTEALPQKLELLKNKELAAYKLGDKFEIETPYFAGLGFDPKLKPDMIKNDARTYFDANNSINYYMFLPSEDPRESQGGEFLSPSQKDYLARMQYFDPERYNAVMEARNTDRPFGTQVFRQGAKTAEELGIEGVPEGAVFVPITNKRGPGEQAFVSNLKNIVADVNTEYGLSQALGALSFELLPGVGLFSGAFTKAGQAIRAGIGVIRGTAGRLARFNLPKSVDPRKIEVDINGDFTPNTEKYLEELKISKQIMDEMESDFRQDIFALKTRQKQNPMMSKTDDFSDVAAMPKEEVQTMIIKTADGKEKTIRIPGIDLSLLIDQGLPKPEGLDIEQILSERSQKFDQNQSTAATFGSRMLYNEGVLRNSLAEGYVVTVADLAQIAARQKLGLGNIGADPLAIQFHVAAQNWVAAQLRRESGAAIGPKEYSDALLQYFPQVGDSADILRQKQALRDEVTRGMINSSGDAFGVVYPNAAKYLKYTSGGQEYDILNPQGYANELISKAELGQNLFFKDTIAGKTTQQLKDMLANPNAGNLYTSQMLEMIKDEIQGRSE